ncbi:MAG: hypothetical protein ACLFQX_05955 [Candidatus Kapaibacterium sp.]
MFIETEDANQDFVRNAGYSMIRTHPLLFFDSDSTEYICVAYFYDADDVRPITSDLTEKLDENYPGRGGIERRLAYADHGYIYTAYLRKKSGRIIARDTLFESPVFIPGPGMKARDIFNPAPQPADTIAPAQQELIDTTESEEE